MMHSLCVMMTCHGIHMDMAQVLLAVQYTLSDMAQLVSIPSVKSAAITNIMSLPENNQVYGPCHK